MGSKQEKIYVSATFLRRAAAHIQKAREPLLDPRLPEYSRTLEAWPNGEGGYTLSVPWIEWELPFTTWREYMEYLYLSEEDLLEDHGIGRDRLDEEIDNDTLNEMYNNPTLEQKLEAEDTVEGAAYKLLSTLPGYLIENVEDISDSGADENLGVLKWEGGLPGWDQTSTEVPSDLALSVLQYILDELGRGIYIELQA